MTDQETGFTPEQVEVNDWRSAVRLPVVTAEAPWNSSELERKLTKTIKTVLDQSLKDNDGKIYTTLSGGVDSSLCLAIVFRVCPPNTPIYTVTIGGSENNPDILFAREVSQMFKTDHHEVLVSEEERKKELAEFLDKLSGKIDPEVSIKRGDVNLWIAYKKLAEIGAKSVIAHDGIDELMGGYWPHCGTVDDKSKQQEVFYKYWKELQPEHLEPLEIVANYFGITLLFPYLQKDLVEYVSHIPVSDRASIMVNEVGWRIPNRKIPLRKIAEKYLNPSIVNRDKRGFIDALRTD